MISAIEMRQFTHDINIVMITVGKWVQIALSCDFSKK